MRHLKLPYSTRKFLRREKARIRREIPDQKGAEKKIREIVASFYTGEGSGRL